MNRLLGRFFGPSTATIHQLAADTERPGSANPTSSSVAPVQLPAKPEISLAALRESVRADVLREVRTSLAAVAALEAVTRKTAQPIPRGRPGGIKRAQLAHRWNDGKLMSAADYRHIQAVAYNNRPTVKGGRARAATAARSARGRFLPDDAQ